MTLALARDPLALTDGLAQHGVPFMIVGAFAVMAQALLVDGRNLLERPPLEKAGFRVLGIGW